MPIFIELDRKRELKLTLPSQWIGQGWLDENDKKKRTIFEVLQGIAELNDNSDPKNPKFNIAKLNIRDLVFLLWVNLIHEDPSLTIEQLMAIIDKKEDGGLFPTLSLLMKSIAAAMPEPEKESEQEKKN